MKATSLTPSFVNTANALCDALDRFSDAVEAEYIDDQMFARQATALREIHNLSQGIVMLGDSSASITEARAIRTNAHALTLLYVCRGAWPDIAAHEKEYTRRAAANAQTKLRLARTACGPVSVITVAITNLMAAL
jgi:hypothetical protein